MEKDNEKKPNFWFFAEWVSIIGTFLACFVFLFHENQLQFERHASLSKHFNESLIQVNREIKTQNDRADRRADKLYEMFYEVVKERK